MPIKCIGCLVLLCVAATQGEGKNETEFPGLDDETMALLKAEREETYSATGSTIVTWFPISEGSFVCAEGHCGNCSQPMPLCKGEDGDNYVAFFGDCISAFDMNKHYHFCTNEDKEVVELCWGGDCDSCVSKGRLCYDVRSSLEGSYVCAANAGACGTPRCENKLPVCTAQREEAMDPQRLLADWSGGRMTIPGLAASPATAAIGAVAGLVAVAAVAALARCVAAKRDSEAQE